jgi:hypothetical protein
MMGFMFVVATNRCCQYTRWDWVAWVWVGGDDDDDDDDDVDDSNDGDSMVSAYLMKQQLQPILDGSDICSCGPCFETC